jgi:hypothetical protein
VGPLVALGRLDPHPARLVEIGALMAANLAATLLRYLLMRVALLMRAAGLPTRGSKPRLVLVRGLLVRGEPGGGTVAILDGQAGCDEAQAEREANARADRDVIEHQDTEQRTEHQTDQNSGGPTAKVQARHDPCLPVMRSPVVARA